MKVETEGQCRLPTPAALSTIYMQAMDGLKF